MKYVDPVVIYKIIDLHNYMLMTLYGKILRGLFEHERLKPENIRTNEGNVQNLIASYDCRIQDLINLVLINSR